MPDTLIMRLGKSKNTRTAIIVLCAVDAFLLWANLWVWMPNPSSTIPPSPVQTEETGPVWEGDLFNDSEEEEPQVPHVPVPEPPPEEEATRAPGEPTSEHTATPSGQPEPSEQPTWQPTPEPTLDPSPEPTEEPTPQPSES